MKKTIITVIVLIIVLAGIYYLAGNNNSAPANQNQNKNNSSATSEQYANPETPASLEEPVFTEHVVIYTDDGYTPSSLSIKEGESVKFENQSSRAMWTASDLHPSHTAYEGTALKEHCPDADDSSFDACGGTQPGEMWKFTFTKKGNWNYHNHLAPSHLGAILVE